MHAVLLLIGTAALVSSMASAATTYTTKYDNIEVEEILNNDRLYQKYYDCLVNKGKCSNDGKQLKEIIPDALKTGCSKCSGPQKAGSEKVIRFIHDKHPAHFDTLESLYDPQAIYRKKYAASAAKKGIKLN